MNLGKPCKNQVDERVWDNLHGRVLDVARGIRSGPWSWTVWDEVLDRVRDRSQDRVSDRVSDRVEERTDEYRLYRQGLCR